MHAVPFLPSLLQEKVIGIDVGFCGRGMPLLVQFKPGQALMRFPIVLNRSRTLRLSFPRKRGSSTPQRLGLLDSRFRGNDSRELVLASI